MSYQDGSLRELQAGLRYVRKAHEKLPENPGVLHTYALFIADLAVLGHLLDPEELDKGVTLVEQAIDLDKNPSGHARARFYHTRARLHRLQGCYDKAHEDIVLALQNEDPDVTDYQARITMYLAERAAIETERSMIKRTQEMIDESQEAIAKATWQETNKQLDEIRASQTRLIEAVAFIAAALALVQTALAAAVGQPGLLDPILIMLAQGIILFGAVLAGAYLLRRGFGPK